MAYVHIAHDCVIGNNVVIVNSVNVAGEVNVGDCTIISGNAAVRQFVNIGAHAYIGGYTQVRKDVPPFIRAAREPLAFIGVNSVGLRRRNFPNETIYAIQEMYRRIYLSDMNPTTAITNIEETMPQSPERDLIVNFIRTSKNGIVRGATSEGDED
jgi:UDP-N-acetylglucosamine acyltransferase